MFEIFFTAVTLQVVLTVLAILLVWSLFRKNQDKIQSACCDQEIPGPLCLDEKLGNQQELVTAGSLFQLLETLHSQYGPIVKFHLGPQLFVSLANGELMDQLRRLFNRPYEAFAVFEPLTTRRSLQFANDDDGLARRNAYDRHFSHAKMEEYEDTVIEEGERMCREWQKTLETEGDNARICLQEACLTLSFRSIARCCFGAHLKNAESVKEFREAYEAACCVMEENALTGRTLNDEHPQIERFRVARDHLYEAVRRIIQESRDQQSSHPSPLFVDFLGSYWKADEELQMLDSLVFLINGFHTTGFALVHSLNFLAAHPEVQGKLRKEVTQLLKSGEEGKFLSWKSVQRVPYLRECIDETMRMAQMGAYAARVSDKPLHLTSVSSTGESSRFTVPGNTPVLLTQGVSSMDPAVFHEPHHFRPERFLRGALPKCAFEPFGVGRRRCPGYRFAYLELSVWLVQILSQFRVILADPTMALEKTLSLVVRPKQNVYVHLNLLPSNQQLEAEE